MNNWTEPMPSFSETIPPHEIFERFITNEELNRICEESTKYARMNGNHNFVMTIEKLKSFLAILLVSGYVELPRQEIYWKRLED